MREIKFRVWDKAAKRMSEPFSLFGEFTLVGGVHSWQREANIEGDSLGRLNDLLEMQFTGLKDKNKVDIYEGDIMRRQTGYVFEMKQSLYSIGKGTCVFGYQHQNEDEIIGNIYEAPELIK